MLGGDSTNPDNLRIFGINGILPAHTEYTLSFPLRIKDRSAIKPGDTFNIQSTLDNNGIGIYSYFRFGKLMTDSDGNSPLDSTADTLPQPRIQMARTPCCQMIFSN